MPSIRFNDDEGEAVRPTATPGTATKVSPEVARVATNMQLAEHIGTFVAGELTHRFGAEDLADKLKGKNAIHVSVSWG